MTQTIQPHPGDEAAKVSIYKPFFLAGMLSVLTSGCLLGAVAMLGISLRGSYTSGGWTPYILAHANSQLYGWVGLFVMGFALQAHPPRASKVALFHRLAFLSLLLIGLSIPLRFFAEPLVAQNRAVWMPVGIASGVMQFVAVLLFVLNTGMTRHRPRDPQTGARIGLPWQSALVFASLLWWLVVAAAEPVVFAYSHQADTMDNVMFVARWFVPYREAQFLGFVINMIFGVALARLSAEFGAPEADRGMGLIGFATWNAGLLLRIVGWLRYYDTRFDSAAAWPYQAAGIMLAIGAIQLVLSARVFERPSVVLPAQKFLRAAFGWLLFAGLLLMLEPLHLRRIGAPFSHAYTGAIRHALTVGFISQMILGVSMHVVPRFRGVEARASLWSVFWLLNTGNALRVAGEIVTDYSPGAFLPMGATGFIELTGLVIWAAYVGRFMMGAIRSARIRQSADVIPAPIS